MNKVFSIALDGPAGAGKSSIAKQLAKTLGAVYLDTGAMYRTMGLYMKRNGITEAEAIAAAAGQPDIRVRFEADGQHTYLDGEDVTPIIRSDEASKMASAVGKSMPVRHRLVELQREIARSHSIVMDGRDIGTDVLPNATLKIFLTATPEERARRRYFQMYAESALEDYASDTRYTEVLTAIRERDYADSHRDISPMRQAEDAVLLDSTCLTEEEVEAKIAEMLKARV